ncbi:uncharacterized protein LOC100897354 [Galendromus occidentalis]|uniref:Uncharacterized protein LOC100897354 n=1 Tax=Galendromus occidentalis TaxID=34638 RepID=A0AAJ6VZM5_9ACAR|nr:uncharacterized protein LOC100897354 [Galendromus occidentalis]
MRPLSENAYGGIQLEPCQVCNQAKERFYLCNQSHSTCIDCGAARKEASVSQGAVLRPSPAKKQVSFSLPLSPDSPSTTPPRSGQKSLSPSSASSAPSLSPSTDCDSPHPSPRRARPPSNDPPSIFSFRSPIKSLVTVPRAEKPQPKAFQPEPPEHAVDETYFSMSARKSLNPPKIVEELVKDDLKIFCQACDAVVEVTLVALPLNFVKSILSQKTDSSKQHQANVGAEVEAEDESEDEGDACYEGEVEVLIKDKVGEENEGESGAEVVVGDEAGSDDACEAGTEESGHVGEDYDDASSIVPMTSVEVFDHGTLRKDVDWLRHGLATACSELMTTRETLEDVISTTEKLEMDVDMLRGGVNYVYFNFDNVLRQKEVRIEERICGIPFVLMVRMRQVGRVPHLGFFIGLEKYEGRAHSPLKKIIVFRAHNAYGKVIEKHSFETFEKGQPVHPCFDLSRKSPDSSLWGYANFLKRDRIVKPDMLKEGRLCLSLQIKPLP